MIAIYVVDGELLYSEVKRDCFDQSGHVVCGDCAVTLGNLRDFLDLSDDAEIIADPMAGTPALLSKHKKAEINSVVVLDAWQKERTPAITLLKKDEDGNFVYGRLFQLVDKVPQRFWEAMYPDAYHRAIAKTRGWFFPNGAPFWYFVGENTKTLYMVYRETVVAPYYCAVYDSEDHNKTRELGSLDGLNRNEFREAGNGSEFSHFTIKSLVGTDYEQKKIEAPEDILFMRRYNAEIETTLSGILTAEEIAETRKSESARMQLRNECLV